MNNPKPKPKPKPPELAAAKAGISQPSARRMDGVAALPLQTPCRYGRSHAGATPSILARKFSRRGRFFFKVASALAERHW